MTEEKVWNEISPFFSKSENWGDWKKINPKLLYLLRDLRISLGVPIVITCGTQGKHVENSQHYIGNAVDIVLRHSKFSIWDEVLIVLSHPFNGVGYYPEWTLDGEVTGGFHLDVREATKKATWIGITQNQARKYVAMNDLNLSKADQLKKKLKRIN